MLLLALAVFFPNYGIPAIEQEQSTLLLCSANFLLIVLLFIDGAVKCLDR